MKKCKTCKHFVYELSQYYPDFLGSCKLILCVNDLYTNKNFDKATAYSWDYEGYESGNHVGDEFGCIKHEDKINEN